MGEVKISTDSRYNWQLYREYSGYSFWEIHEAVFMLTGWPDDEYFDYIAFPRDTRVKIAREVGLVWNRQKGYPDNVGNKFLDIFSQLKRAVELGEIRIKRESIFSHDKYYGNRTLLFLYAKDLILWFILNDLVLPQRLQNELSIFQIADAEKTKQNHRNSVKNQIVAQYLLDINSKISITEICKHPWMLRHGTAAQSADKERKVIRNDVSSLIGTKRKAGRPPKDRYKIEVPKYTPKPISEVVQWSNFTNLAHYNFSLFRVAITTAAEVKLEILGKESIFQMTENDFLEAFYEDSIVQLYQTNDHGVLKYLATKFALEILHQRYFHNKSLSMPIDQLKKIKISQIWTIYNFQSDQEEILDPFCEKSQFSAALYWKPPK